MIMHKYMFLPVLLSLLVFLMTGCSEKYGKLRLQYGRADRMTIERLKENWQGYHVYWAGLRIASPSAVMFDPKSDDKTLVSDKWLEVKDLEDLDELITWIGTDTGTHRMARLMMILGPNDEVFGYIYSQWDHVHMKAIDGKTLWVDDLPLPPIDYGAGERRYMR